MFGGVGDQVGGAVRQPGAPVQVVNDARSGVSVDDLPRQVDLAIAQQPDLVTVLIGANDICRATVGDMTSASSYSDTVQTPPNSSVAQDRSSCMRNASTKNAADTAYSLPQ